MSAEEKKNEEFILRNENKTDTPTRRRGNKIKFKNTQRGFDSNEDVKTKFAEENKKKKETKQRTQPAEEQSRTHTIGSTRCRGSGK